MEKYKLREFINRYCMEYHPEKNGKGETITKKVEYIGLVEKYEDVLKRWIPRIGLKDFFNEYTKRHNNLFNEEWYTFVKVILYLYDEEPKTFRKNNIPKIPNICRLYIQIRLIIINAINRDEDYQYFKHILDISDFALRYDEEVVFSNIGKELASFINKNKQLSNEEKRQKLNELEGGMLSLFNKIMPYESKIKTENDLIEIMQKRINEEWGGTIIGNLNLGITLFKKERYPK